jgi:hypothetical protein
MMTVYKSTRISQTVMQNLFTTADLHRHSCCNFVTFHASDADLPCAVLTAGDTYKYDRIVSHIMDMLVGHLVSYVLYDK